MEIWDILDEHGNRTGRTIRRGDRLQPGEYYLAVHIWIVNGSGEYLIQRRSDEKPLWPGMWAATGGAAVSGESSREAALREVEEEIGVTPDPGRMEFLCRIRRKDWFTDLWLLRQDISLSEIVMQPGEVSGILWADTNTIREMVRREKFVNYSYLDSFLDGKIIAG